MTDYLERLLDDARVLSRAVQAAERAAVAGGREEETAEAPDVLAPAAERMEEMEFLAAEVVRRSVTLPAAAEQVSETGAPPALLAAEGAPLPILRAVEQGERTVRPDTGAAQPGRGGGERTELPSLPAPDAAAQQGAQAVDLAFQRDSRRYDNGFSLL